MRVRFTSQYSGYAIGDIAELPDDEGLAVVRGGFAEPVGRDKMLRPKKRRRASNKPVVQTK